MNQANQPALRGSVVIPTHEHGPLLRYALSSALAQTVQEIEVLVIGDGVPRVTREIMDEVMADDERVQFFDYPKGPHKGEKYRAEVLGQAKGAVIAYLSDDDLWLPCHLEAMERALEAADFAHALPLRVDPDGQLGGWNIDLQFGWYRKLLLSGENRIPLSCGAHLLTSYRGLSNGWQTTDIPTDLYMWQQFLTEAGYRSVSSATPTVLHFPSPQRKGWTKQERAEELELWYTRVSDPGWRDHFLGEVLDLAVRERAHWEISYHTAVDASEYLKYERDRLAKELAEINATLTIRFRNRLLRVPALRRFGLWLSRQVKSKTKS